MAEWTRPPGKITRPGQEAGGNYREEETTVSESITELRFLSFFKGKHDCFGQRVDKKVL